MKLGRKMIKSLSRILLMAVVFGPSIALADSYIGYSIKSLDFVHSESTDAVVYEDSYVQAVDFTLSLADKYYIGAVLDLDQEQERSRKILVKLGFEKWGAVLESGQIAGRFATDSELNYQPASGDFKYDYEGIKLYKRNGWNSKHGFTYAKWSQPSRVTVNLDWDDSSCARSACEMAWVDPEVEYSFIGWFMANNLMERLTKGASYERGMNFEAQAELGFLSIKGSDTNLTIASSVTDQDIRTEPAEGIGTKSTFRMGYYTGGELASNSGYSLAVGIEASMVGFILGGRSSVDEDYVTTPDQYILSYGPFVSLMVSM